MATLLEDEFVDTDGVALTDHTMNVGSGWANYRGSMQIQSNSAVYLTAVSNNCIVHADAGQADVEAYVDATTPASGKMTPGICGNAVSTTSLWLMRLLLSSIPGTGTVDLYELSGVTYTLRNQVSMAFAASTTYRLKLKTLGNTITGYVDGVQKVTYTGSPRNYKTQTGFGMVLSSTTFDSGSVLDNFLVTDGAATGSGLLLSNRRNRLVRI